MMPRIWGHMGRLAPYRIAKDHQVDDTIQPRVPGDQAAIPSLEENRPAHLTVLVPPVFSLSCASYTWGFFVVVQS